ncbi:MAG: hypothetical protein HY083_06470 [Gammaproteobacteria bacterium]|nr:hypothetical protein [Gammaproteobacteria bacterium]
MTSYLTKLIAILLFSGGTAFASINPAPSAGYEDFQAAVDRIVAEGTRDGCSSPEQVVWL